MQIYARRMLEVTGYICTYNTFYVKINVVPLKFKLHKSTVKSVTVL